MWGPVIMDVSSEFEKVKHHNPPLLDLAVNKVHKISDLSPLEAIIKLRELLFTHMNCRTEHVFEGQNYEDINLKSVIHVFDFEKLHAQAICARKR